MPGKIVLEEHFALPDTIDDSERYFTPDAWPTMRRRLLDFHEERIRQMDRFGVELAVVSLNAPGVQAVLGARQAVDLSQRANDFLADQVRKNPVRFQGLAALPMQDPDAAARELTRCVAELGFRGALVSGFSQIGSPDSVAYYDQREYWPFWETVEKLGVPFYLHPRDVSPSQARIYEGHPWLFGAPWSFGVETAGHALRLMGSGLFDAYPKLAIVLGHLGEGLPPAIWRIDHRIAKAPRGIPAKKKLADYLRQNFYLTTSGNFCTGTLQNALQEMGASRVMFSVDYPFEDIGEAAEWFDNLSLSSEDRLKIASGNAEALFKLRTASPALQGAKK